jgi:hypothetical protein
MISRWFTIPILIPTPIAIDLEGLGDDFFLKFAVV